MTENYAATARAVPIASPGATMAVDWEHGSTSSGCERAVRRVQEALERSTSARSCCST